MKEMESEVNQNNAILFFDGVCGLCNGFVDFMIKRDKSGRYRFASLQGETARELFHTESDDLLDSVILKEKDAIYKKSDAVLRVLISLGGVWAIFKIFTVIPTGIRDWMYDCVAKYRYNIFGIKKECRVPSKSEVDKFLP